jgi:hypothetical protein
MWEEKIHHLLGSRWATEKTGILWNFLDKCNKKKKKTLRPQGKTVGKKGNITIVHYGSIVTKL